MKHYQEDALGCEFIHSGNKCVLMESLNDQDSDVCKLFRQPIEDCRYLRLYLLRAPIRERGKSNDRGHKKSN